jgi:hypothetical protein
MPRTPRVFEGFQYRMYKKYSGGTFSNFNTNFAFADRARARLQIRMQPASQLHAASAHASTAVQRPWPVEPPLVETMLVRLS